jgi:hypothetical protein
VGDSFTLTTIGAGFSSGAGVAGHGTPTTLKGSTNATAGHPGGTTSIWSSPGGTPGTDAASDVVVDVLDPVTGVTAKFAIETLGTRFFGVGKSASTDTRLDLGASKVVDGASFLTIESGTGIDVCINARPGQNGTFLVQANSANFPVLDFYVRASGSRYLIHAATPAIAGSAGDVLGICSGAAVNATKMPAGTVDRGVFWGKANAVPTVGCDNTGNQLYVDPTTLAVCAFEHGGTLHHFTAYDASLAAAPSAAPVTIRHPTARYKTTATGAVTIAKILGADIPSKSIGGAIVRVRCRDTVDDTAFQGLRQVEWDKTGGGTLTCTVTTLGADRGSLCTLSITVSSGDIIIQVNPSKADDIRHYVKVDFDNCQD